MAPPQGLTKAVRRKIDNAILGLAIRFGGEWNDLYRRRTGFEVGRSGRLKLATSGSAETGMDGSGIPKSDDDSAPNRTSTGRAKPIANSDSMHGNSERDFETSPVSSDNSTDGPDEYSTSDRYNWNPTESSASSATTGISDGLRRFEAEDATATITASVIPHQATATPLTIFKNIVAKDHSYQFNGHSTHILNKNLQINVNPDSLLLPVVVALAHEKAPVTVTVTGTTASTTTIESCTTLTAASGQLQSSMGHLSSATVARVVETAVPTPITPSQDPSYRHSDTTPLRPSSEATSNLDITGTQESLGSKTSSSAGPIPRNKVTKSTDQEFLQLFKQKPEPTHLPTMDIRNCLLFQQSNPAPPTGFRKLWALFQRKPNPSSLHLDNALLLKIRKVLPEVTGRAAGRLNCVESLVHHLKELDPSLLMMVMPLIMAGNQISGSREPIGAGSVDRE